MACKHGSGLVTVRVGALCSGLRRARRVGRSQPAALRHVQLRPPRPGASDSSPCRLAATRRSRSVRRWPLVFDAGSLGLRVARRPVEVDPLQPIALRSHRGPEPAGLAVGAGRLGDPSTPRCVRVTPGRPILSRSARLLRSGRPGGDRLRPSLAFGAGAEGCHRRCAVAASTLPHRVGRGIKPRPGFPRTSRRRRQVGVAAGSDGLAIEQRPRSEIIRLDSPRARVLSAAGRVGSVAQRRPDC